MTFKQVDLWYDEVILVDSIFIMVPPEKNRNTCLFKWSL